MAERIAILSPLDAEHLQNIGHLGAPANGTRKLHRRRLNRSSDEENRHIPLDVTLDSPPAALATEAFTTIPERLISKATLEHLGFTGEKATALWDTWNNIPQPADDDGDGALISFIESITDPFDLRGDAVDDGDDEQWRQTMDAFGLRRTVQDKIMDPYYANLRQTRSCAFWCKDTIEMRYEALRSVQESSLERQRSLQSAPSSSAPFIGPIIPTEFLSASTSQGEQRPDHSQTPTDSTTPSVFDGLGTVSDIATNGIDGYTVLFKGIDEARTRGFLDDHGNLMNVQHIQSAPPSDFSNNQGLFYFTPELDTARYYAGYAKVRGNDETNIVIICIAIPHEAINSLNGNAYRELFWPDLQWKEYVRYNRARLRSMPTELRQFRQAILLVGSTAKGTNQQWRQTPGPSHVTEARHVLMIGGRPAVQYCFNGNDDGIDFLQSNIAPRPYMHQFTKGEMNDWRVANRIFD